MNITDIEAAAGRLRGHANVTPLLSSPFLDEIAGRQVFVKAECLQVTGSFKFRGGLSAVSALPDDARGVIAFSSGNHAQGVAMAARMRGLPCVIIMPADAPALKLANTRALGAEVVTYNRASENRDEIGARMASECGLTLIKPFDEPMVIAGQGTCGLEIATQAKKLGIERATVLTCCGGGGLTSGIALALETHAPGMIVRTVEPEGFDDVARSLAAGRIVSNAAMSGSVCDAIVTPRPGDITFPIMQHLCGPGLSVTDEAALRAVALAFLRLKIVLEPGGAVALAAALVHGDQLADGPVICTATGGNVDPGVFRDALERYAEI